MEILFATTNANKLLEIRNALQSHFTVRSLSDINLILEEVDEPYNTLEENAVHKATSYAALTGIDCFSEDTGLEVDFLNGAPGVRSARFAGEPADTKKNIELLLSSMGNTDQRNAQFRTVIALSLNSHIYTFEGICKGRIINQAKGEGGFGYDPVFIPEGADLTFAEMRTLEKNNYSHRKKAFSKMISFLREK
ncbi:MAG: RdgB/HAM1 family non-canonical purine NTP pyrophosphatase [Bacteroidota bacterium]|jgi:XTP/dITP diphosphohydrolase